MPVVDCVLHGYREDEDVEQMELQKIAAAVESAPDEKAPFRVFDLGPLEDALDQLSGAAGEPVCTSEKPRGFDGS